jgi:YfiH family protein
MPFFTNGAISYYQFEIYNQAIRHAVFTRRGGMSPEPWSSLNMGSTVGDEPDRVRENRKLALATQECEPSSVFDVWQVHSANVVVATAPRSPETPHLQADAIITNQPRLVLMMRFADCVPILLHDPIRKAVGIVHAGWLGTVRSIVSIAVGAMQNQFQSNPADLLAAIGPSIGPDHYEVGSDVVTQVKQAFGSEASKILSDDDCVIKFNLWEANRLLLERAGVKHIEVAELCTACHTEDWFSHRAEKGRTGRFGAFISLK